MKAANLSLAAGITILMWPGILRTAEPELVTLSAEGEAKMVIAIPEAKNLAETHPKKAEQLFREWQTWNNEVNQSATRYWK